MKPFFNHQKTRLLLPVLALPALGAFVGITTQAGVDGWYQTLTRPGFNPPDWVFGLAWTILYIMMGIVLGMIWRGISTYRHARQVTILFALQLLLNVGWSYAFFYGHALWLCTVWTSILILVVSILAIRLWPWNRIAALLLFPYIMWLCFALVLGFSVAVLNPQA